MKSYALFLVVFCQNTNYVFDVQYIQNGGNVGKLLASHFDLYLYAATVVIGSTTFMCEFWVGM